MTTSSNTASDEPPVYGYAVETVATQMGAGGLQYLHRECWYRMPFRSGDAPAWTRDTWSSEPLKTLHQFLEELGVRDDCQCVECTKEENQ